MRLWSIHPGYLDPKGLVALWREALLAQKVLAGQTKGYRHHPQLERFKETQDPLKAIGIYLEYVWEEAFHRGYAFDRQKIIKVSWDSAQSLTVTDGQIAYELMHLKEKCRLRDGKKFMELRSVKKIRAHPIFKVVKGDIEDWEVIRKEVKQ